MGRTLCRIFIKGGLYTLVKANTLYQEVSYTIMILSKEVKHYKQDAMKHFLLQRTNEMVRSKVLYAIKRYIFQKERGCGKTWLYALPIKLKIYKYSGQSYHVEAFIPFSLSITNVST